MFRPHLVWLSRFAVGYGDVNPTNRDEYLLVTVIMIAGGFLWAYVIGGICNVVASMNIDKGQFMQVCRAA